MSDGFPGKPDRVGPQTGPRSGIIAEAKASDIGGPGCGLGFELALVLPPLMWARRRRRRSA